MVRRPCTGQPIVSAQQCRWSRWGLQHPRQQARHASLNSQVTYTPSFIAASHSRKHQKVPIKARPLSWTSIWLCCCCCSSCHSAPPPSETWKGECWGTAARAPGHLCRLPSSWPHQCLTSSGTALRSRFALHRSQARCRLPIS